MSTATLEGFSISHAAVLDGTTGADTQDIFGVRSGTVSVNVSNYDNTGDDAVQSVWFWFDYAEVAIQSGYLPFSFISLLSGETIHSSGTAPTDYYSLPLWTLGTLNQATKPLLLRIPAKDSAGTPRTMDLVLYRVQFSVPVLTGPSYKTGLLLDYHGRGLLSTVDETGTALTNSAIGRIVSRPTGTTNRFI